MTHFILSPNQLATIEMLLERPPADIPLPRLQIVARAAQGMTTPEIAKTVGCHASYVNKWIRRYKVNGIDGLRSEVAPGRQHTFDAALRAEIARLYASSPRTLGFKQPRWSLRGLRECLISTGLAQTISVQTIRQCIKEATK